MWFVTFAYSVAVAELASRSGHKKSLQSDLFKAPISCLKVTKAEALRILSI